MSQAHCVARESLGGGRDGLGCEHTLGAWGPLTSAEPGWC